MAINYRASLKTARRIKLGIFEPVAEAIKEAVIEIAEPVPTKSAEQKVELVKAAIDQAGLDWQESHAAYARFISKILERQIQIENGRLVLAALEEHQEAEEIMMLFMMSE